MITRIKCFAYESGELWGCVFRTMIMSILSWFTFDKTKVATRVSLFSLAGWQTGKQHILHLDSYSDLEQMKPQANHNNKKVINKSKSSIMKVYACGRSLQPLPARAQQTTTNTKTKYMNFPISSYVCLKHTVINIVLCILLQDVSLVVLRWEWNYNKLYYGPWTL